MDKQFLTECLEKGMSSREIAKLHSVNISNRTILYYVHKYNLEDKMNYKKPIYKEDYFSKINTKEKAYILGYIIGDSYFNNETLELCCSIADKEILEFISSEFGGIIREYYKLDKSTRTFPHAEIHIGNKKIVNDLHKLIGKGTVKKDRNFPMISKNLQPYMLLGFFDADGCLTWGRRKDRNRIWQKVNFTGAYNTLFAIQKLLIKQGISSALRKKGDENCYVLELSSKKDVLNILDYMYGKNDLIVLHRKFEKNRALRLELGEVGGTGEATTIPSQAEDHSSEGVETTGGKVDSLNDQQEDPSLDLNNDQVKYSPINGSPNDNYIL